MKKGLYACLATWVVMLAAVSSLVVGWLFYSWKIESYGSRH